MGAGVSGWRLARAVSKAGHLGVVAGTALDVILVRSLQLGDEGGHLRRALAAYPDSGVAARILERWFIDGGKPPNRPFAALPVLDADTSRARTELTVVANFVEVWLAKEGHAGRVGINYLEKIQQPTLPSLYGAMLAGVDHVLMGAGIPRHIPAVLDDLAAGRATTLPLDVRGDDPARVEHLTFDPAAFLGRPAPELRRPRFFAIVASLTVATVLTRKSRGRVDGLVVEGPSAGGHNAPPRGRMSLDEAGEPIYGERDLPDLASIAALGLPFWLAGSYADPRRLRSAVDAGAAGIQVGTAFAFCSESGLRPDLKHRVLRDACQGRTHVRTDPSASPTGFPFKVVQLPGTASDGPASRVGREVCDLGYLRHAYRRDDGKVGWRCPAEPERIYRRKGGHAEDTRGRACVCNGLLANIGLGQVRDDGWREPPLLTSGSDLTIVARLAGPDGHDYSARDVIEALKQPVVS